MPLAVADELDQAVVLMRRAVDTITRIITPHMSAQDFHAVADKISQLDRLFHTQQTVRTTAGFLADKHHSGDRVGSRIPESYITKLFTVSSFEARRIVTRGRDTYKTVKLADITSQLIQSAKLTPEDPACETAEDRAARLKKERDLFEEAKRVQEQQQKAQQHAARLMEIQKPSDEYLRILDQELRALIGTTQKQSIRAQALSLIGHIHPEDFKHHVRNLVRKANASNKDPRKQQKKRFITLGRTDSSGGAHLSGYLPASSVALFQNILGATRPAPTTEGKTDDRTVGQRRHDTLMTILASKARYDSTNNKGGIGSILLSMTTHELQDILDETNSSRLQELIYRPRPTNTEAMISLIELMDMGLARYDITCLHDQKTGNALYCGRTSRSAALMQKIALVAQELVCSHPGCDVPACLCDVHHIQPWSEGGSTDIANLTFRCRNHHMDNNDHKNPALPRGWAEKDPNTGRTGHHTPPGSDKPRIEINHSMKARQAAGYKIYRYKVQQEHQARQTLQAHQARRIEQIQTEDQAGSLNPRPTPTPRNPRSATKKLSHYHTNLTENLD